MDFINELAPQMLSSFSLYGYILVFIAGVIAGIGPCNLSIMPILMAYVGGSEIGRQRGFALSCFFTLGSAVTFVLLGIFIAMIGGIFGTSRSVLYYIVAAVCILMGLNLTGILKFSTNFGNRLLNKTMEKKGLTGSFVLGMIMGLVGSQCGTPILLVILSLAFASGQWIYGATLLFVYALGQGIPIILVGTFTALITRMEVFARWNAMLEKTAGIIIIIMGVYFLWLA
ncbi:MAG TPA: cytochrome c biogenesis protein CcdA [Syntrophomonadaceae bacterium]|nr:cytochrome c biogenesis protein CcdA [Syntrophomonadaceae bacterium]HRX22049.1 cytochrome c biogenesis protein CcdA [Syntrophomonadaceae bacterium]